MPTTPPPLFSLAHALDVATPASPISIAQAWQLSYPSSESPLKSASSPLPLVPFINLSQGVPGQNPSARFLARLSEEASKNTHHAYCLPSPALRQGLATQINEVYRRGEDPNGGGAVRAEDVTLTAGCNMASLFAFQTLCQPGGHDAVVLPTPFYFNHSMQLLSLAVEPVPLPCAAPSYLPCPTEFEQLLERHAASEDLPNIKALVLVTPNNPTGAIYPPELIENFAIICKAKRIALILDETYRDFIVSEEDDGDFKAPHGLFRDDIRGDNEWQWRQTIFHLYSFSKSYSLPGHRLGALICHPYLTQASGSLAKAADNTIIVPPRRDSQEALAWAMSDREEISARRRVAIELKRRRDIFKRGMDTVVTEEEFGKYGLGKASCAGKSLRELGWQLESLGGYYAFVRHPFNKGRQEEAKVSSSQIAQGLASLTGLGVLAADGFMADVSQSRSSQTEQSQENARDVCANLLRFSLANVADSRILQEEVPIRMALFSRIVELRGKAAVFGNVREGE